MELKAYLTDVAPRRYGFRLIAREYKIDFGAAVGTRQQSYIPSYELFETLAPAGDEDDVFDTFMEARDAITVDYVNRIDRNIKHIEARLQGGTKFGRAVYWLMSHRTRRVIRDANHVVNQLRWYRDIPKDKYVFKELDPQQIKVSGSILTPGNQVFSACVSGDVNQVGTILTRTVRDIKVPQFKEADVENQDVSYLMDDQSVIPLIDVDTNPKGAKCSDQLKWVHASSSGKLNDMIKIYMDLVAEEEKVRRAEMKTKIAEVNREWKVLRDLRDRVKLIEMKGDV